jgi:5-methylcytosine-specific restriction enzyme A
MPSRIPFRRSDAFVSPNASERERAEFYGSPRWRKLRARKLRANPVCEDCGREFANTVHHVEPRLEHPALAFSWSNLKSMCGPCHTRYESLLRAQRDPRHT